MSNKSSNKEFKDIIKLEEEISNFFEDLMYDRGGSPLLGRIFALCVLTSSQKPLLQKELVDKFEVNPSTISRNLKELENWKLIDRRREPGSREWKYQVESTAYLELLVNEFEENVITLREREGGLKRIRERWGETMSQESRESPGGKRTLQILDFLINWMEIVATEQDELIKTLHRRFLELEKKLE
ncbi:hypothetical protein CEE45_06940 [Candidatus Heimdallarchaeota archaeon B3_Heim]|nr:MAG: hypothetical protein CEE45_06940 [Candidatus Heimdallarchaeota archaeon B3_Heim]